MSSLSSSSAAIVRLTEERKNWRKDSLAGFYARPAVNEDNSTDLTRWNCGIPGREKTDWEGGLFKVQLRFPKSYPMEPPICSFTPVIFHPNVFSDGNICLSIIGNDWTPSITVKQILQGIQDLLASPNPKSPANCVANELMVRQPAQYAKKIKDQTAKHIASTSE